MTLVFGSSSRITKIDFPPMPSRGFTTTRPCSATNAVISRWERVMSVGGQHSASHIV